MVLRCGSTLTPQWTQEPYLKKAGPEPLLLSGRPEAEDEFSSFKRSRLSKGRGNTLQSSKSLPGMTASQLPHSRQRANEL